MKKIIFFIVLTLIIGCTQYVPTPYPVNNTIYRETIIYNHTIEYINVTTDECDCNITNTTPRYILGLIRQLKHCEETINKQMNCSDCAEDLEECDELLDELAEEIEELEEEIDDLEDEIDDLEDEC